MKKFLSIGMLLVGAVAISEQKAQAWVNSRFGIGLNWHLQSGNTSYLWGLWRNGQIPGPEGYGGPPPGAPQPFPFYGQNGAPQGYPAMAYNPNVPPAGYAQPAPQMVQPAPAARPQNLAQQQFYNPYQAVSYQPNGYNYGYYGYNYNYGYNYSPPMYYYLPTNFDPTLEWYGPR